MRGSARAAHIGTRRTPPPPTRKPLRKLPRGGPGCSLFRCRCCATSRPHLILVSTSRARSHPGTAGSALELPDPTGFQGRLDRLQILRGQQHHVVTAVVGQVYPLVGGPTSSAIPESRAFASESGTVVIDQDLYLSGRPVVHGGSPCDRPSKPYLGELDITVGLMRRARAGPARLKPRRSARVFGVAFSGGGGGNRTASAERGTQDFSGRSPLRPFSAPAISRTSRRAGLSHCSCRVEPRDRALGQWPSSPRQRPGRGPARADGPSHSLRRRGRCRCAMYWHLSVCDDGRRDHVASSARFPWNDVRRRNLSPPWGWPLGRDHRPGPATYRSYRTATAGHDPEGCDRQRCLTALAAGLFPIEADP